MATFDTANFAYVPVLRWKSAEKDALGTLNLKRTHQGLIMPLFEITPGEIKKKENRRMSIHAVFEEAASEMASCWGPKPAYLDIWHLGDISYGPSGHPITSFINRSDIWGLRIVPVIGISPDIRGPYFQDLMIKRAQNMGKEICVRLTEEEILLGDFESRLNHLLAQIKLPISKIDMIIDRRYLTDNSQQIHLLCSRVPRLSQWRRLTVIGGNFPKYLTGMPLGLNTLERKQFNSWNDLAENRDYRGRLPSFGDYTIQHPFLEEKDGPLNTSASIRYTRTRDFIIMKGRSIKDFGTLQYLAHAKLLSEMKDMRKPGFSSGDAYIWEKAQELDSKKSKRSTGNSTTWLKASINHHMEVVLSQVRNTVGFRTLQRNMPSSISEAEPERKLE